MTDEDNVISEVPGSASESSNNREDRGYGELLHRLQSRFVANVAGALPGPINCPLFTTTATGLFDAYLDALPSDRQYHTCSSCRRFVERYGALVTIDEKGRSRSALWHEDDVSEFYKPSIAAVLALVRQARVSGVFLSKLPVWGRPVTDQWHHLALTPPAGSVYRGQLLEPAQAMAEKHQDFVTVSRALSDFALPMVKQALTILRTESLHRTEKVLGQAQWLCDLHVAIDGARGHARDNLVWRAVATAPAGFCHPRSSMIGSLLEDLAAGMDFPMVAQRFGEKMHPLRYQRPQAAPSAGNIAQAEKVVEKLGIARSLARRYARLEEIETIWRPQPKTGSVQAGGGVFWHLKAKDSTETPQLKLPPVTMTWEKFARTVLPGAASLEYWIPPHAGGYGALVTAVNADVPPIIQWDRIGRRNPVSWYVHVGGSLPIKWGLTPDRFHTMTAVALSPAMWGGHDAGHHGAAVIFLLADARDSQAPGLALFPEFLKSELHGIRATIEAYSKNGILEGLEESSASGVIFAKGNMWNALVRVHSGNTHLDYILDRWD
jgi:hypothetical protein